MYTIYVTYNYTGCRIFNVLTLLFQFLSTSSNTSSSSCTSSDTEYDYQVSLHAQAPPSSRRSRNSRRSAHSTSCDIYNTKEKGDVKSARPPVVKKICKESAYTYAKAKPATAPPKGDVSHKSHRLFKKNSLSPKFSRQKQLMKMKSDEASHSLLRYFRFPSPPRTTDDNSDSKIVVNTNPQAHDSRVRNLEERDSDHVRNKPLTDGRGADFEGKSQPMKECDDRPGVTFKVCSCISMFVHIYARASLCLCISMAMHFYGLTY